MSPRVWLTYAQAAERVGVSERHLKREKAAGRLRVEQIGRLVRTTPEWLDEWVDLRDRERRG